MAANNTFDIANNSTLTTDLNISPYYDDYSSDNKYYRILYKPGYAVQARELTQMQTMLQKQIDRFGKHVFREGSFVLPRGFIIEKALEKDISYVKVKDVDTTNTAIKIENYLGQTVTGQTSGVTAKIENVLDGAETNENAKTIYLSYLGRKDNTNTEIQTFQSGETLSCNAGTLVVGTSVPVGASPITGKATRFNLQPGVFFAKEHFIYFSKQSVIVGRYTTTPSARVGFFITESIVDYESDISLLDPALEASNFQAPGADRLKLDPALVVYPYNSDIGAPNFVECFTIKDGIVTQLYDRPQYNILGDEIAKRTFDESGDYYVRGLNVRVRENLLTANNGGISDTGNNQLLTIGVEPGIGYVKGYEINLITTQYIDVEKSLTSKTIKNQVITANYGNYVETKEFTGSVEHDKLNTVDLYDVSNKRLTDKLWASSAPSGNNIGTARVLSTEYGNGILSTPDGIVNVYLTDINMFGSNNFASVKSMYSSGFGADLVLNSSNNAVIKDSSISTLIYPVGTTSIKNILDEDGNCDTTFTFKRTTNVSDVTTDSGQFSIGIATTNETFPYGTTTNLSSLDKRELLLSVVSDTSVVLPGIVTATEGTKTLQGSLTFFTRLNRGDKIAIDGIIGTFFIDTIESDISLTVTETLPAGITSKVYTKVYKAGDIIDLTTIGADNGETRTVSTTPTQLSIDLKETFVNATAGKLTYPVSRTTAVQVNKLLRKNRYVKIDCSKAGTIGPFNLGFSDVYKINSITKKSGSAPANISDGTVVTTSFTFNNGQKDAIYDHATITPKTNLNSTDYLLVSLDYFLPDYSSGFGYFSVDSYPIDDDNSPSTNTIRTENIPIFFSPLSKTKYDLRNNLDFRPVKVNTANDVDTVGTASINPSTTNSFTTDVNGIRIPAPATPIEYTYSFYQPRRDLVSIDRFKNITIKKGIPSVNPITPESEENTMALASVFVPGYPSLASNYAQQIDRKDLSCVVTKLTSVRFTMKDIGTLKGRIENLEYYASLSLLEKAAVDMKIVDEDGLDRFKNGIFVDSFQDHSFVDVKGGSKIVIDPQEKSIRPLFTMHSKGYNYLSGSNVQKTGDLITLPYSEVVLIDQPRVTSFRNIELSSYRFIGQMELYPATDVWADTDQLPDEIIYRGVDPSQVDQGIVTTWNQWSRELTGLIAQKVKRGGNAQTNTDDVWGPPQTMDPSQLSSLIQDPTGSGRRFSGIDSGLVNALPIVHGKDYKITRLFSTTRTGTETTTSISTSTESIGNRLLDVSIQPYMRPQIVKVRVLGLKPYTKFSVFFDKENVGKYVRPLTSDELVRDILTDNVPLGYKLEASENVPVGYTYQEGDNIISDENGTVFFAFRIAQGAYRLGGRELIITDSPTNSIDASTYARAEYVAYGILQQKQNTILSTRQLSITSKPTTETVTENDIVYINNPSCAAYSFLPKAPAGEEGVFLTSVDLYFQAVHPTLGVWVEIREMDPSGGITRNQIPFSETWVPAEDIKPFLSDDGSKAKNIKFQAPVFLYSDTQYAFVIHTVGLNPDTYFWISRLGETDVKTKSKVNSRPLTGTFYTTNNNLNWNIVDDVDLRITFYRASFTTGVVGQAILGNKPFQKFVANNVSAPIINFGEPFLGRARLTLTTNTSVLSINDYVIGQSSGINSAILGITSDGDYIMSNNRYILNETVSLSNTNGTSYGKTSIISNKKVGRGIVSYYKVVNGVSKLEMDSSNGEFFIGDVITGTQSGITATIESTANQRYSVVDFEPSYIKHNKTTITFEMKPTSNTGVDGAYEFVVDGDNQEFDTEQALFSRNFEISKLNGEPSNKVRVNMLSITNYMSPVLDLGRTHTVYVDNLINANTKGEYGVNKLVINDASGKINVGTTIVGSVTGTRGIVDAVSSETYIMTSRGYNAGELVRVYESNDTLLATPIVAGNISSNVIVNSVSAGELSNKYICYPVTLAEGQDAEDIAVYLTAYRPNPTNVKIWIKILNNEDSDAFADRPWIELVNQNESTYSSLSNRDDFKEYIYKFPSSYMTGPDNQVQYINTQDVKFTGYKRYAIKIGLLGGEENTINSINSAIVPRVADLRVICLQI